nr:reverse transcriptase domain-containing protein [Tanacetum cinerariifolium]
MTNPCGQALGPIQRLISTNFRVKGTYMQMIRDNQFDGRIRSDPHRHIDDFLEISSLFQYGGNQKEAGGKEARSATYSQAAEGGGVSKATRCEAGDGEAGAAVGEGVGRRGGGRRVRVVGPGTSPMGPKGEEAVGMRAVVGRPVVGRPTVVGPRRGCGRPAGMPPLVPAPWAGPTGRRGRHVVRRPRADEGLARLARVWCRGAGGGKGVDGSRVATEQGLGRRWFDRGRGRPGTWWVGGDGAAWGGRLWR